LGGTIPVATGMAFAEKLQSNKSIVVCFLGDGALGEGVVYESFNIASKFEIPILYVLEDNKIAQSTFSKNNLAGSILKRPQSFGIESNETESEDLIDLIKIFESAFKYVRQKNLPFCQIVHTHRLAAHSKRDDTRSKEELEELSGHDPLVILGDQLDQKTVKNIDKEAELSVSKVFDKFENEILKETPKKNPIKLLDDLSLIPHEFESFEDWFPEKEGIYFLDQLRSVFKNLMEKHKNLYFIGEDLLDPYGGAFKATSGLSSLFPNRVLNMPISEAGFMGLANGMALRGLRPVVEIMFGDFVTLILDQLLNHATKFNRMYGGSVTCPVVIRSPMGGYRGYGPTHSQSLEKFLLGIPGLIVLAASPIHNLKLLWEHLLELETPVFMIENKNLYGQTIKTYSGDKIDNFHVSSSNSYFPTFSLSLVGHSLKPDIIILTYGGMTTLSMQASRELFIEEEINSEVIVFSQVSPIPKMDLAKVVEHCDIVVTVEEGTLRAGWGSEISANLEARISTHRYGATDTIIPVSQIEEEMVLPSITGLKELIKKVLKYV